MTAENFAKRFRGDDGFEDFVSSMIDKAVAKSDSILCPIHPLLTLLSAPYAFLWMARHSFFVSEAGY